MSSADDRLRVELSDGILEVVLSRPQARNAIDHQMAQSLDRTFDQLWASETSACVITGEGSTFCAGGDLKERQRVSVDETRRIRRTLVAMFTKLARAPVPVVIAVNGPALGGGFELALCADFIVAAESARFGLPEVDLGIIPGGGGTQHLVRIAGLSISRDVILLGRTLSALEASKCGIVYQVVPDSELRRQSKTLASLLRSKPPLAFRQAKSAINSAWGYDIGLAISREGELYEPCLDSVERAQALSDFAPIKTENAIDSEERP